MPDEQRRRQPQNRSPAGKHSGGAFEHAGLPRRQIKMGRSLRRHSASGHRLRTPYIPPATRQTDHSSRNCCAGSQQRASYLFVAHEFFRRREVGRETWVARRYGLVAVCQETTLRRMRSTRRGGVVLCGSFFFFGIVCSTPSDGVGGLY
ncbi:hypothetical protein MRX96_059226 [Rhipicephalus microplus]